MSRISVNNLTFSYDSNGENVFENVSFSIDSSWKLGFIGRNGKGKTTFLKLLMGKYDYSGNIDSGLGFDYFPYEVTEKIKNESVANAIKEWKPEAEEWQFLRECRLLNLGSDILEKSFKTLSPGEKNKVMLAVLFSCENFFLLIDEPTNHLDMEAKKAVADYLRKKDGFILVSHDRELLDECVDHMLILNRASISVQSGNFSSWWENKEKEDAFNRQENENHLKEIGKIKTAMDRVSRWADKSERSKIGCTQNEKSNREMNARSYIGSKTKKMESRASNFEKRMQKEIDAKSGLLKDVENEVELKIMPLDFHKNRLLEARDFTAHYENSEEDLFEPVTFDINVGDRVFLRGGNGSGKSTVIKAVLNKLGKYNGTKIVTKGVLEPASGLRVSYMNQDTSTLTGSFREYAENTGLDYSLFLAILRQLDFDRAAFDNRIEQCSEGQKKKVLVASSLLTPANLYIWDEPFNYIDVFSRIQIEKMIERYKPTLLIVEHDARFTEKVATRVVDIKRRII